MTGYSQYQSAQYNAAVARNNQVITNRNASMALQQGTVQEENQRLKTGGMIAGIDAQQAASGVNPNEGSALNVRSSAAETGELDALTIRYNANVQNWNYKNQANVYGAQASLYNNMGDWAVANSILGGASSVSNQWLKYNQAGVWSGSNTNVNPGGFAGYESIMG
jgi:hypothetical protein